MRRDVYHMIVERLLAQKKSIAGRFRYRSLGEDSRDRQRGEELWDRFSWIMRRGNE